MDPRAQWLWCQLLLWALPLPEKLRYNTQLGKKDPRRVCDKLSRTENYCSKRVTYISTFGGTVHHYTVFFPQILSYTSLPPPRGIHITKKSGNPTWTCDAGIHLEKEKQRQDQSDKQKHKKIRNMCDFFLLSTVCSDSACILDILTNKINVSFEEHCSCYSGYSTDLSVISFPLDCFLLKCL